MSGAGAPLPRSADVVVVGGGAVGTSVAFHLAEAGVNVLLLERDGLASGSSGKPVGGVRAQFSEPANVALAARSLRAYADFPRRPGADIGLRQVGYLFLLPTDAHVAAFAAGLPAQHAHGVPSRLVDLDEAVRLNPYVDPTGYTAAAWSPTDGWALPGAVVRGYADAAVRLGARVRTGVAVTGTDVRGGVVMAVRTPAGDVRTSTVVCCAGAWSRSLGDTVGVDLPVTPLRRQIAFSAPLPRPEPDLPFTIDQGSTFYVHGAGDGLLLGLADPEQAPGFGRDYDPSWLPTLRAAARRCVPALADVPLVDGWAGLYEMTPDRNALIGEATGVSRFLYACGFSGHGFLQAPAVGEAVRDLVLHREPVVDVRVFHAERFAGEAALTEAAIV
ncbi:NAD(P)/FAD-dependent oxidoreductase [Aquipuribacter nitratireducens]|uniref:NAD(P)/FAD-dependent oxidoreductase n=1 Tax=Aquipuribacter nitratireducens TaxID=650104 RepID=A0ABW0GI86_9MICO